MFKIMTFIVVVFAIGCQSNSSNNIKTDTDIDTLAAEIKTSPVEKVELKGQDLLDSFADEYYLHYPDNVMVNEMIKLADSINPRRYYKNKDFVNALKYYRGQVIKYPDKPYVNFYAAMSAYNAGDYEYALEHYNRQQRVFPDHKYTLVTYYYEGLCYLRTMEVEKCEAQMEDYLNRGGIMHGRIAQLNQDIRLKWDTSSESQP